MSERREPYHPLLKSYPDSEKVNAVSIGAETLFTRLIAAGDDRGRYYGDAGMILGKLYTRRFVKGEVNLKVVAQWLMELKSENLIALYRVGSNDYLEIIGCRRSLRSDVNPDIRFPDPPNAGTAKDEADASDTDTSRIREDSGPLNQTKPNQTKPKISSAVADSFVRPAGNPAKGGVAAEVRDAENLPPGFVRFWAAWPSHFRKQGRKKCVAKWRKEKLERHADAVGAALEQSKASEQWRAKGGQFIPYPMSWLNNTPWESELADLAAGGEVDGSDNGFHREPMTEDLLRFGDGGES